MGLRAAEQLVAELAANRVGTDVKPTEDQQELNIPGFLVYLFGIVIAEEEYQRRKDHREPLRLPNDEQQEVPHSRSFSFSPTRRESRFAAFQKQYWASVSNDDASVVHKCCSDEQKSWISSSLASKPFKLTTRVYPSKEQKEIIKQDLLNECEKLESLSNAALESLLREEESSSSSSVRDGASKQNKKRRGKKKKKKQNNKPQQQQFTNIEENTFVLEGDKEDERKVDNTLEEVVATTLQHSSVDSMLVEQNSWVEVRRNEDKQVAWNANATLRQCIPEGKDTPNNASQDIIPAVVESGLGNSTEKGVTKNNKHNASASASTSDPRDVIVIGHENKDLALTSTGLCSDQIDTIIDNTSSSSSSSPSSSSSSSPISPLEVPSSKRLATSNASSDQDGLRDRRYRHTAAASTTITTTNAFELAKQTQRIADLELELSDANRQLAKERMLLVQQQQQNRYANTNTNNATTKTKPWREEKERYENLIRALQLRLYISENKLRTYEEALESHVRAVSTVSSSSNATGTRTDNNNNNEEQMLLPNSPSLISKVLGNKKGIGKAGGCIW
uniref:Uncharacterized protein n=1 Tax=Pseudo-nitzschia australis TaxID=44445 RepID=A0A7S4AMM9_9STRA